MSYAIFDDAGNCMGMSACQSATAMKRDRV